MRKWNKGNEIFNHILSFIYIISSFVSPTTTFSTNKYFPSSYLPAGCNIIQSCSEGFAKLVNFLSSSLLNKLSQTNFLSAQLTGSVSGLVEVADLEHPYLQGVSNCHKLMGSFI